MLVFEHAIEQTQAQLVDVTRIEIDVIYQREWSAERERMVKRIVERFDPSRFDPVHLGRRPDGSLWCADGQARLVAARRMGHTKIWAKVFGSEGVADEADHFLRTQEERKGLNLFQRWKARIAKGDAVALAIEAILRHRGFVLRPTTGKSTAYQIRAVRALEACHAHDVLDMVLQLIDKAWHGEPDACAHEILEGTAYFFATIRSHDGITFDFNRLVKMLEKMRPVDLIRQVAPLRRAGPRRMSIGIAKQMIDVYNARLAEKNKIRVEL